MRPILLATLLFSCLGWTNALGSEFACPEFRYPTLRSHDLGAYRLTEHGPDPDRPDYLLQVDLEHEGGTRWCFVADFGRLAVVGGGEVREPIDLTGNGHRDVVIQVLGYGNSCDESVYVIELEPEPRFLYRAESFFFSDRDDSLASVCRVTIVDLDDDGIYELLTYDSLWDNPKAATGDCSHAATPYLPIALAYRRGSGYEAVDPYHREPLIAMDDLRRIHTTGLGNAMLRYLSVLEEVADGTFERDHRCAIVAVVLPIVYRGQAYFAHEVLALLYLLDDIDAMEDHIAALVRASPFLDDSWSWPRR
jgi:hypothetical protein